MFCKNCGSQIDDNTSICPSCGTILKSQEADKSQSEEQNAEAQNNNQANQRFNQEQQNQYSDNPYVRYDNMYDKTDSDGKNGLAIASLCCSIAGVFGCCFGQLGILLAVLGIIFGIIGLKSDKKNIAFAGIIVGIVMLLFSILSIILANYAQHSPEIQKYINDILNQYKNK